jgi:hypothetical protein
MSSGGADRGDRVSKLLAIVGEQERKLRRSRAVGIGPSTLTDDPRTPPHDAST